MTASTLPSPRLPGAAALAAAVWLILAIAAGATGFFLRLPFPGPQLIILGLVVLTLVAGLVPSRLSAWIDAIPLRVLVGVNAVVVRTVRRSDAGVMLFEGTPEVLVRAHRQEEDQPGCGKLSQHLGCGLEWNVG